ncbi:MAG TPA: hypothetical protein DCY93_02950 [Firmicutes bacterium]|nr:hypothetical protein [Bacillota bacterium]
MDITLIANLVLVGMIALVVIASLIGLWKGIWKTSFKLIFRSICFVVMIFCSQPITNAICKINFATTFHVDAEILDVKLTTFDETLANILVNSGKISPVTGSDLYGTCLALAHSLLSCAIFFVLMILTLLIGSLLATLFYHLIFKHFISKKLRKKKKIRWAGALCGLLDGALCMVMLFSPLSSMAKIVTERPEYIDSAHEMKVLDDNTYNTIKKGIDAYNSSALYSTLKVLSPVSDGIVNQVVEVEVNGVKMGLLNELETLLTVVKPVLPAVTFNGGNPVIDYQKLLAKDTIKQVLELLGKSKLIINIIPGLISMGQNVIDDPSMKEVINELDFKDIDWKNDMNAVSAFYEKIYDAGLFNRVTPSEINFTVYLANMDQYCDALTSITSIEMIDKNLPFIMSPVLKEVNKSLGQDIFPTDSGLLKDLDWDHELKCLATCLSNLLKAFNITSLNNINFEELLNKALKDNEKIEFIRKAICGDEEKDVLGLLNLNLIDSVDLESLVTKLLSSVPSVGEYVDERTIHDVFSSEDMNLIDEFNTIIDIVPLIYNNPNLPLDKIDFKNNTHVKELKNVISVASNSKLMLAAFPGLVKKALKDSNISSDMLFGLSVDDLSFTFDDSTQMKNELTTILDIASDALEISDTLSNSSLTVQQAMEKLDLEKVRDILVKMYKSSIINPSHRIDGSAEIEKDRNFEALIEGILKQKALQDVGVIVPNNLSSIEWYIEGTKNGEIDKIVNSLQVVKNNMSFFTSGDITLDNIDGKLIKDILTTLGKSDVFAPSLASIFNKNVSPIIQDIGVSLDFYVVKDWENEGECLARVVDSLKKISSSADLANIDWLNSDLTRVNAILTAFSQTNVLGVRQQDTGLYFDYFGDLLDKVFNNDSFQGVLGDSIDPTYFQSCDPSTGELNKGWKWVEQEKTITIDTEEVIVTEKGEIANLINLLSVIQTTGVDNITGDSVDANTLRIILESLVETNTLSIVLPDMLEKAIQNIAPIVLDEDNSIDLRSLNTSVFYTMTKEEKKSEINYLVDVYNQFKTGELDTMFNTISNLTEAQLNTLQKVLDDVASMKSFTVNKPLERLSLHETIISSLFNYIKLDQMITNNVEKEEMTAEEKHQVKLRAKTSMQSVITSITDWVDTTSPSGAKVMQENSKIIRLLRNVNGIDINNLNNMSSLSPTQVRSILSCFNDSKILHQALPTFFEQAFELFNITTLITVDSRVYYDINYRVHLTTSEEDMAFWNHELEGFFELADNLYKVDSAGNGYYIDSSETGFNEDVFDLYRVLGPIDKMDLLSDNKEYIVYSYLRNTGAELVDLVRDLDSGANDHIKAARIRKLFFPYAHTEEDLREECNILNSFLKNLASMVNASFDKNNLEITGKQAYDLVMKTMMIKEDGTGVKAVKSLFASEIVASYLTKGFKSVTTDTAILNTLENFFFAPDDNGRDYLRLNIVEARGIKGMLDLASATDEASIVKALKLMGSYSETISTMTLADAGYVAGEENSLALLKDISATYYSDYRTKRANVNSQLAFTLFKSYTPNNALFDGVYTLYLDQVCSGDINNLVFEDLAYAIEHYDITDPGTIPVNPDRPS